jgi:hypothetical protein
LASLGLTWEDVAADYIGYVWPDNELSVTVFNNLGTQWRVGMRGPYGLDYSAMPAVCEMNLIDKQKWPSILDDIRILEMSALETIHSEKGSQ